MARTSVYPFYFFFQDLKWLSLFSFAVVNLIFYVYLGSIFGFATPTKPELAFTMDLMKLLHTLNLEGQVAVKYFCSAIQTLIDDISFLVLR